MHVDIPIHTFTHSFLKWGDAQVSYHCGAGKNHVVEKTEAKSKNQTHGGLMIRNEEVYIHIVYICQVTVNDIGKQSKGEAWGKYQRALD